MWFLFSSILLISRFVDCVSIILTVQQVQLKQVYLRCDMIDRIFCLFLGVTYRGSHYIQPELSPSQLSFSDLFLDPDTGRVRQTACASVSGVCWCFSPKQTVDCQSPGISLSCRFVLGRLGHVFLSVCGAARWSPLLVLEFRSSADTSASVPLMERRWDVCLLDVPVKS